MVLPIRFLNRREAYIGFVDQPCPRAEFVTHGGVHYRYSVFHEGDGAEWYRESDPVVPTDIKGKLRPMSEWEDAHAAAVKRMRAEEKTKRINSADS